MSSVPHQPELYDTLSSYNPKNPMMANKPKQAYTEPEQEERPPHCCNPIADYWFFGAVRAVASILCLDRFLPE